MTLFVQVISWEKNEYVNLQKENRCITMSANASFKIFNVDENVD